MFNIMNLLRVLSKMDKVKSVKNCFNSKAYLYEHYADIQPLSALALAKSIKPGDIQTILEVGCGTGLLTEQLLQRFPGTLLHLNDVSADMLAVCQQRVHDRATITLHCGDIQQFKSTERFDLITSNMTLHWLPQLTTTLGALSQLLTPNGQFAFSLLGSQSLSEWKTICLELGGSIPTPRFPKLSDLKIAFPQFNFEVSYVEQRYENAYGFLKTLKNIGANFASENHQVFSAGMLRQLMRAFDKRHSSVTYEIIYGNYTQS
jgi:malonyl-CoA O-methyltransferase